jgi:Type IX secretion system protein PorV
MKKFICIVLILFVSTLSGQNKIGTTAAEFLTIPVGSKAIAMGGAFVAVSDDITSAYWNPAGLSRLKLNEFNVNYSDWLLDTRISWAGIGVKIGEDDYASVSIIYLDYGDEPVTTVDFPEGTGQMWDATDIAISLSYARNLTDRFSIGGSFKYIQQKIWNESASAFAFDVGLLYKTQFEGLNLGMSISNFGQEMKLDGKDLLKPIDLDESYFNNNPVITTELSTDSWELPLIFSVGVSWTYPLLNGLALLTAVDAKIPSNQNSYINLGCELQWHDMFFVRMGRNSLFKEFAEEGITFGAGLKHKIAGLDISIEYAFLDFGIWSNLNRYSVAIGF